MFLHLECIVCNPLVLAHYLHCHIAEDNNTRVLFERVLTSGQLEGEKSQEVWNRFLDFEAEVGDLASILKVEKRRTQVLGDVSSILL